MYFSSEACGFCKFAGVERGRAGIRLGMNVAGKKRTEGSD